MERLIITQTNHSHSIRSQIINNNKQREYTMFGTIIVVVIALISIYFIFGDDRDDGDCEGFGDN